MQKLKLDLDALNVISFATGSEAAARGTIRANDVEAQRPTTGATVVNCPVPIVISLVICDAGYAPELPAEEEPGTSY